MVKMKNQLQTIPIAAGYYSALKDVEKTITQLEKNAEELITK